MKAVGRRFSEANPGIRLEWEARSLQDFEDFPVETLAAHYDVMMIDHPHIGTAAENGVFEPMDDWLSAAFLEDQRVNSVGPGYGTYTWNGRQWALSVDEAAQVCAYPQDLKDWDLPRTWEETAALAASLPAGQHMAFPLVPTHAFSCFVTLNANIGGPDFWQGETAIRKDSGEEAFAVLQRLASASHPCSFDCDPIGILDAMSGRSAAPEQIVYAPLVYGYSNYAREGYGARLVRFADIPSAVDIPRGSMIGGVGVAVSSRSFHKAEAMRFAEYLASEACQCGPLYFSGGQPGYLKAWLDESINADSHGFFRDTLSTLQHAYVRPRKPGYCAFQRRAGAYLRSALLNRTFPADAVTAFNQLFTELVARPA
jgi:ABC-type sugar transport system, periplasmic component